MIRTRPIAFLVLVLLLTAASPAFGGVIGYGGRLTDATGTPVAGPVGLSVSFFAGATGGSPLDGEAHAFAGTALHDGVFQLSLALTAADESAVLGDGSQAVYVEVTDVTHHRTYPRQRLMMVPYALRVPVDGTSVVFDGSGKLSVGAVDAAKVTGLAAMLAGMGDAAKLQGVPLGTGTPAAGAVLKYVAGQWQAVAGDSVAGNFGIGTTSAQTALDVAGVLTQRGAAAPGVAPAGEGRIYFDTTSNQFMVSQNGGAYAPLGTVTGGVITQVSAGSGLTGGGTTGNVTVGLAGVGAVGTYTKVLTDAYGRVTAGGTLTAADLPTIPVGLISGSLPVTQISGTLAAAQVASIPVTQLAGTLATTQLPSVPVTQIAGTLTAAQLPSLSGAQITSGTLSVALGGTGTTSFPSGGVVVGAGSLPLSTVSAASQYQVLQQGASGPAFGALELGQGAAVSGTLAVAHLPPIPMGLVTGTLAAAQIGTIPVTQLSGTLAAAQVAPIPMTQLTGTLAATQVAAIPATQLAGTLATAALPGLPASLITGNLPVTQLAGTLAVGQLPSLPASQITSGTFALGLIPSLPASQITSGTLPANRGGFGLDVSGSSGVPNFAAGSPSFLGVGTAANNLVQLNASSQLPALDGSQLVNVTTSTTAVMTLYVDTANGNDANACTASGTSACKTIMAAVNKVPKRLRHSVTIYVASGTYNEEVDLVNLMAENGSVFLIQGTGGNFTVSGQSTRPYGFVVNSLVGAGAFQIQNATVTATTLSGILVYASPRELTLNNVTITANTGDGLDVYNKSRVEIAGNFSATSNGGAGISITEWSYVLHSAGTLSSSSNQRGIILSRFSDFTSRVGSLTLNGNTLEGLNLNLGASVNIAWTTGGTGIQIGAAGVENGTSSSTPANAIIASNGSRVLLQGNASSIVSVRSKYASGIVVTSMTQLYLTYANVSSNGASGTAGTGYGVICSSGVHCQIDNTTASSNNGHGIQVTDSSTLTLTGTVTASSNTFTGVAVEGESTLRNYATLTTSSNTNYGVAVIYSSRATFYMPVTTSSNGYYGLYVADNSDLMIVGALTMSSNVQGAVQTDWGAHLTMTSNCTCSGASNANHQSVVVQYSSGATPIAGWTAYTGSSVNNY